MKNYFFTSESVTEGHPDKLCDYISDNILDEYLKQDENSRVAVETFATGDLVVVAGQVTSDGNVNIEHIVRDVIKEIGFNNKDIDIDYRTCKIIVDITKQSPDIAMGVDIGGAGDQGIMFGYACDETENYMPLAIDLAHKLAKRLTFVRKNKVLNYLRPDGKTQVTIEYENDKPKRIENILISAQHEENIDIIQMKQDIKQNVIYPIIDTHLIDENTKIYINPTGKFVIGGPLGDTGLTGRKIIVDSYGGYSRHGGGAFSGKDATKVDRSASYMLRHIAKNIVANNLAKKCELQVSYAIGMEKPLSLYINTFGTANIPEEDIISIIQNNFDLTPNSIINYLNLKQPIYTKTTNYGHFGKDNLSYEKIIKLKI
ncbi:MAG: methionine adenosyltransferase [Clostridia bacterium]|nr:methionine adenosyltransferase [Clostridia bacterium]